MFNIILQEKSVQNSTWATQRCYHTIENARFCSRKTKANVFCSKNCKPCREDCIKMKKYVIVQLTCCVNKRNKINNSIRRDIVFNKLNSYKIICNLNIIYQIGRGLLLLISKMQGVSTLHCCLHTTSGAPGIAERGGKVFTCKRSSTIDQSLWRTL